MPVLRQVVGETLRGMRMRQRRTLREVSATARVSLGYLSEVERGQKEPSSELLAAICDALQARLSDVLREVSIELAAAELAAQLESERIGVAAPVPTARVGAAAGSGAVKSMPLAKPVPRGAVRPGTRPAARPVTRRVPAAAGVGATMTSTPNLLAYPVVLPGGLNAGSLPVAGSGQVPQLALR